MLNKSYFSKIKSFLTRKQGQNQFEDVSLEKMKMIKGIEELPDTTVKEVMVPRIDVEFFDQGMSLADCISLITMKGYSRYPVYKDTIDNIIGMIYAKDILRFVGNHENFAIEEAMRKVYFVPESKKLDELLREFKRRKLHIAVSVDEYGGVSGIICLEDILELIVGDIQDEFDNESEDIVEISANVYLCDARTDIDELNDLLHLNLPNEDFETIGGFVFELFGKIPVNMETVSYKNVDFIVHSISGHKINTVKLVVRDTCVD